LLEPPAAKLLELGLTPSDSEQFLTPPEANGFFPKSSNGAEKRQPAKSFCNRIGDNNLFDCGFN